MIWSPAEQLPRAELRRLQLERLRATFDVEIDSLERGRGAPVHRQVPAPRGLSLRPAARARRVARAIARVERDARQADGCRVHARRSRRLDRADGALHDDGRRSARHARAQREHVRPVHGRPRLPPGRRADRGAGPAGLRRLHRAAGVAPPGPRRAGARLDALVCTRDRAGRGRRGHRSRDPEARARPVRRRALDRRVARGDRAGAARPTGRQLLRAVGDVRPGRRDRVPRGARRPARPRGPLPRRSRRPGDRGAARTRASRASSSSRRC